MRARHHRREMDEIHTTVSSIKFPRAEEPVESQSCRLKDRLHHCVILREAIMSCRQQP